MRSYTFVVLVLVAGVVLDYVHPFVLVGPKKNQSGKTFIIAAGTKSERKTKFLLVPSAFIATTAQTNNDNETSMYSNTSKRQERKSKVTSEEDSTSFRHPSASTNNIISNSKKSWIPKDISWTIERPRHNTSQQVQPSMTRIIKQNNQSLPYYISNATKINNRSISNSTNQRYLQWRVWETANRLERHGVSIGSNTQLSKKIQKRVDHVTKKVVSILRRWGDQWAVQYKLKSLLDKNNLLGEIEESIIALAFLTEWLDQRKYDNANHRSNRLPPVTVVDVCCGKGIFSMLTSYMLQAPLQEQRDYCRHHQALRQDKSNTNNKNIQTNMINGHISNIIMLDKARNIDWSHIKAANEDALEEGRPMIELWSGCNLHDTDQILERIRPKHVQEEDSENRLEQLPGTMQQPSEVALVGIHLCKGLSPTFIGIINLLGPNHCPFFCLAPCCLPSAVYYHDKHKQQEQKNNGRKQIKTKKNGGIIEILQYETRQERKDRMTVLQMRKNIKNSRKIPACILCESTEHGSVQHCRLLPSDRQEQIQIFRKVASITTCRRCGVVGHFKDDCPSKQTSCVPTLIRPPIVELDVSNLIENTRTNDVNMEKNNTKGDLFFNYCGLLSSTIQMRGQVEVLEAGLTSHRCFSTADSSNINNQNAHRKSIFIVAK